jgi:hypothetical protein
MPVSCSAAAQRSSRRASLGVSGSMSSSSDRATASTRPACSVVDLEAALQLAHRGLADVRVPAAARARSPARRQVEDHALAQGAARRLQLVDAEVHRQRVEQRQAAGDDGAPVVAQAGQVERVGAAGLEAALHQPAQALGRDRCRRPGRSRRAPARPRRPCPRSRAPLPSGAARTGRSPPRARRRRRPARAEGALAEAAVGEVLHRQADAADLERLGAARPLAAAEDHLGRAAADVDDEARHARRLQLGHARIDEARLLAARDDLDRPAERRLGAGEEGVAVLRLAQRLRRDRADLARGEAVEPAREARQAVEAALRRLVAEEARGVEAAAEAHRLLEGSPIAGSGRRELADLEPKAVRAHVDRGDLAGPAGVGVGRDGAFRIHRAGLCGRGLRRAGILRPS